MGLIDIVSKVAPGYANRYALNKLAYEVNSKAAKRSQRLYDAATSTQYRKTINGAGQSPDNLIAQAGTKLRDMARHLEENHDLTNAIFDDLLNNTIGAGVSKTPMAKTNTGELAKDLNDLLLELFDEFAQSPDTANEFGFESLERQIGRHYFRDGEIFIRPMVANSRFSYKTGIPFVLDLLPAEYCPMEYDQLANGINLGVKVNQWGAPQTYYFHKNHPSDVYQPASVIATQVTGVSAANVMHIKLTKRIKQRRGVTLIHSVVNAMQDVKDALESERIAAKVAADFTFAITKSSEVSGPTTINGDGNRSFGMTAGMGFELLPGEDVKTIASDRPNSGLNDFIKGLMRNVAGGTGTRYSAISKDYNGTYSAQRQELVEGTIGYRSHFVHLKRKFYAPMWEQFVFAAVQSGRVPVNLLRGVDRSTLARCEFRPPSLPWIDPQKEAKAWQTLVEAKLESRQEIMRSRSRDPSKVIEEMQAEADNDLFGSMIESGAEDAQATLDNDNADTEQNDDESNAA